MKHLIIILSVIFLSSCLKENEVVPVSNNLFRNGSFDFPWETNIDFYGSCACIPKMGKAWYWEPLNDVENPALVFLTEYRDSINGPLKHQYYYTGSILEIGQSYEFSCKVYECSVNHFQILQLNGEIIAELVPDNSKIQTFRFIADGPRLKFNGISAVGLFSLKKYNCNDKF